MASATTLTLTKGQSVAYHGKYGAAARDRVVARLEAVCRKLHEASQRPITVIDHDGTILYTHPKIGDVD